MNSLQGIMFLIYPLLGHLADVYLTRYRALKCGLMMVLGGCFYLTLYSIANTIAVDVFHSSVIVNGYLHVSLVLLPAFILLITGQGLFEANAIQFGLDQLLEAPTPKLIAFIHWYYWAQSVAQLIICYFGASIGAALTVVNYTSTFTKPIATFVMVLMILNTSVALILHCIGKKHLHSRTTSQPIQEYLQSAQVLLEAQGP